MGRTCLKFSIVFFNIILMLIGAAALGIGVWILVDDDDFIEKATDVLDIDLLGSDLVSHCSMAMITAGAVIFVLGTMGCVGAFALSSFMLVFYSLALMVLLTVEVAVVVLAIVFRDELLEKADNEVLDSLHTKYGEPDITFTKSFDSLQKELECCGWKDGDDYKKVDQSKWNTTLEASAEPRVVPDSCCLSSNETLVLNCVIKPLNDTIYSAKGCKGEVEDKFTEYIWLIIGLTAGLLTFQFLLIVLALCLVVRNVGKKYDM